ncbi:DUF4225 domain-containing protein [uncultured Pluralibacter sp.]|uniref:DUF4225 domain-containing protein n=1 Tax=uncultured Pluralibacter sp. TaxID=1490864 RepID=UPI0026153457|nr:DUF4225 domain-containing protein [uncultured Pluralibacter sp.]
MDIFIPGQPRFRNYFLTMARAEISGLMNVAFAVSSTHLKDALTRVRFQDEVRNYAYHQMEIIRHSNDDKQCQQCIRTIQQERDHLLIQDRMLRTGEAVLTASVRFYKENEKVIGYVIDGIGVVLSGMQIFIGIGIALPSLLSGNVIGVLAGATIIANGAGSLYENIEKLSGESNPQNPVKNVYGDSAEFMGFDRKLGTLAYQMVDLSTSFYGLFKLALKPEAMRLFTYLPGDYYRKINTLGKPALLIEAGKATWSGVKIGKNLNHEEK